MISQGLTRAQANRLYLEVLEAKDDKALRRLAQEDLFFLLTIGCKRKDADHDWLYGNCREVEAEPDGFLDLWAREHFKSSIITFALTIKDILNDPNITVGIFSHTRPIAKAFLSQIKQELEQNTFLKSLFPDVLWAEPKSQAPKWSLDSGIIVKRDQNPKESTIEAWGLVDGQPTALCVDTPTLTINGWKHHGDLKPGDYVFGENGKPVMVVHNTGPMFDKPCVKVVFDDTELIAAEDHLWGIDRVISPRNKETNKQDSGWSITEREIVKTTELPISRGENRDKRRRIPMTPTLDFCTENMRLPIEPYTLGWWLGDGSSAQDIITTGDYSVLDSFSQAGYEVKVAQDRGNYKMFRLIGLRDHLKELSLLKNKHIPIEYLYATPEVRLALFQGLMDSDGSCTNKWGQCVFTNCNRTLIEQTHYLACSLGMKPSRITEYHDGHPAHKPRLTFCFTGEKTNPPFRLARKLEHCRDKKKNTGRYVRRLEKIDSVPVNCIQVASEDGMYLAGKSLVPTHNSKHFALMVYDDVVTRESVSTTEQIKKTTAAWELSTNLGAQGGKKRYIGTRYHANDTYKVMMDRGSVKVRLKPAREGGTMEGRPVFMSDELLIEKRRDQGPYTFGSQMLLNPTADKSMGFKPEWLCYYKSQLKIEDLNIYLLVDPASEKKDTSDYTVMKVIGLGPDNNYYLVDAIRDRMNLTERTEKLFYFHRKYKPLKVGYEKYGKDSDIEHIKYVMEEKNYRFDITPVGGQLAKEDRIKRLVPIFEQKRMWLPERMHFTDYEGRSVDYIHSFVNDEYLAFPVCVHDDMLDCMARILDPLMSAEFPKEKKTQAKPQVYRGPASWMG